MRNPHLLTLSGLLAATVGFGTPLFADAPATAPVPAPQSASAEAQAEAPKGFSQEQIEQLLAPVALYPDALLAQVLMASTYPLDVVQGARWVKQNEKLKGEELQKAVEKQPFDVSVQTLVHFPTVLQNMSDNLEWTQDLGEAYLGQEKEVTDAVQKLRQQAMDAGNLKSNDKQQVIKEEKVIVVQPADPKVVYVPTYTQTVYQQPPPTTTYYPSTVYIQEDNSSENFLAGAIVGGLLTAAIIWNRNDNYCCGVWYGGPPRWGGSGYWGRPGYNTGGWRRPININGDVNINRGNNVNIGNKIGSDNQRWKHDVTRRGNIEYRNQITRTQFSSNRAAVDRDAARGRLDRGRDGNRSPNFGDIKIGDGQFNGKIGSGTTRPATRDIKGPTGNLGNKLGSGKPASLDRPAARPASPAKRDIKLDRPKTSAKPSTRTGNREIKSRPRDNGNGFNPSNRASTRAASDRGNRSINRSGGGGARAGGGGGGLRGGGGGGLRR